MIVLVTVKRLAWVCSVTLLGASLLTTSRSLGIRPNRSLAGCSWTLRPTLRLNSGFAARSIAHHGSAMYLAGHPWPRRGDGNGVAMPVETLFFVCSSLFSFFTTLTVLAYRRLTSGRNGGRRYWRFINELVLAVRNFRNV